MGKFTEKRFLPLRMAGESEKERLLKTVAENLFGEKRIVFAYVHGSFVLSGPFRDIDIGIFAGGSEDFTFESDLSYRLSSLSGYEVEIHIINHASVAFQMAVLQTGRLLFSRDENIRTDFIEDVGRRYKEYAHFRNVFMEAVR